MLGEGKDSQVPLAKICPVLHRRGWKSKRQRVVRYSEHCNSPHPNTIITRLSEDYFSVEKKKSGIGGCWGEQGEYHATLEKCRLFGPVLVSASK